MTVNSLENIENEEQKLENLHFLTSETCCVGLFAKLCLILATPWTVDSQVSLSMGFSRQEYWNGLPFPSPGNLPNPGIKSKAFTLQADSLPTELAAYSLLNHCLAHILYKTEPHLKLSWSPGSR